MREEGRVHLVVAGHDGGDVNTVFECSLVPGDDGGPDTTVLLVADRDDAGVVLCVVLDLLPRSILRAVIDSIDLCHESGDRLEGLPDQELLVVGRHHDGDAFSPVQLLLPVFPDISCRLGRDGNRIRSDE